MFERTDPLEHFSDAFLGWGVTSDYVRDRKNRIDGVEYVVKNKGKLDPGVHLLPPEVDQEIARRKLRALEFRSTRSLPNKSST